VVNHDEHDYLNVVDLGVCQVFWNLYCISWQLEFQNVYSKWEQRFVCFVCHSYRFRLKWENKYNRQLFCYFWTWMSYRWSLHHICGILGDCVLHKLISNIVVDCSRRRKLIKDVWWLRWLWVGECFFWYQRTRVVPDPSAVKRLWSW